MYLERIRNKPLFLGFCISGFRDSDLNSKRSLITKLRYWHRTNVTTCKQFCPFNSILLLFYFFSSSVVGIFVLNLMVKSVCVFSCGINKTNYQISDQSAKPKWKINTNFRHVYLYFLVEYIVLLLAKIVLNTR